MTKQRLKDIRYLRMVRIWATNSYAIRLKVGCLIVSKDGNIISDGYNGTPMGFENVCEVPDKKIPVESIPKNDEERRKCLESSFLKGECNLISKPYVLHAEANAITKLARSTQSSEGATLYCTDMPCVECSKLIIQAGIVRVVYERPYRITDGVELLKHAGIQVDNIPSVEIEMNRIWDEEFVRQKYEICDNCRYDDCNNLCPNCPKLKRNKRHENNNQG